MLAGQLLLGSSLEGEFAFNGNLMWGLFLSSTQLAPAVYKTGQGLKSAVNSTTETKQRHYDDIATAARTSLLKLVVLLTIM